MWFVKLAVGLGVWLSLEPTARECKAAQRVTVWKSWDVGLCRQHLNQTWDGYSDFHQGMKPKDENPESIFLDSLPCFDNLMFTMVRYQNSEKAIKKWHQTDLLPTCKAPNLQFRCQINEADRQITGFDAAFPPELIDLKHAWIIWQSELNINACGLVTVHKQHTWTFF